MTPTNEHVVSACQRAGITKVYVANKTIWLNGYSVESSCDTWPGSALFIVAVLGALKVSSVKVVNMRYSLPCQGWCVLFGHDRESGTWERSGIPRTTLTAACMAAIVAAYPEVANEQ